MTDHEREQEQQQEPRLPRSRDERARRPPARREHDTFLDTDPGGMMLPASIYAARSDGGYMPSGLCSAWQAR